MQAQGTDLMAQKERNPLPIIPNTNSEMSVDPAKEKVFGLLGRFAPAMWPTHIEVKNAALGKRCPCSTRRCLTSNYIERENIIPEFIMGQLRKKAGYHGSL